MRRSFRFRLQRVEDVRSIEEQLERERWARAQRDQLEAEARVEGLRGEIARARGELRRLQGTSPVDTGAILAAHGLLNGLFGRLTEARRAAFSCAAEAEARRRDWAHKKGEHEGLQRLEERERDEHRREVEKSDQAQLDESAGRSQPGSPAGSSAGPNGP